MPSEILHLPPIHTIQTTLNKNPICQLLEPERWLSVVESGHSGQGRVVTPVGSDDDSILLVTDGEAAQATFTKVLRMRADSEGPQRRMSEWLQHPALAARPAEPIDYLRRAQQVLDSWVGTFSYREENSDRGIKGLRTPQIGALHAIHAHWTTTDKAATIVMPTGTGKTETMLSILISERCPKLLVIVPTDALRVQLVSKFVTLGLLKDFMVVGAPALYPIVGMLKHRPKGAGDVDSFFERCNVVVTTAHVVGRCSTSVQERMAHHCPYLFIDEAHHVAAATWHQFKEKFIARRVVQFTATPFRNDGKLVGGKIIYNFPLKKALEQDYFRPIRFDPVIEFTKQEADEAIAAKAVAQLREDCQHYDHILMARVATIERAAEVHAIYQRFGEFSPVQIHTGMTKTERDRIHRMIATRETRIIVCVDMFGEGFDVPELKIAALHDIKKSLAVTLQLAGRFTRAQARLGEPTFIANIGDVDVQEGLRRLYMQDADWNTLLIRSSEEIIEDQISLREFLDGFGDFPDELSLHTFRPALSTVIYRTKCSEWRPDQFIEGISARDDLERLHHGINHEENIVVIVTARRLPLDWAHLEEIYSLEWELLVVYWNSAQNLLFINSSSNRGYFRELAEAIAGKEIELVSGPSVFRSFAGINRLKLQNVGLTEQLGRLIRYTMRAGPDVETGLSDAQKRNTRKANIFGVGYEYGEKASIGCSYKGRIWSHRTGNLQALIRWCEGVGAKILDDSVDADQVLSGTLTPYPIVLRPNRMPIGVEWPHAIYAEPETAYEFVIDDKPAVPLYLADLRLTNPTEDGPLTFELYTDDLAVTLTLVLEEHGDIKDYRYEVESGRRVTVKQGRREYSLAEFFYYRPPAIWFVDGSLLEGNSLTELKRQQPPYPRDRIQVLNWTGTDIGKESQGTGKDPTTIQYRVIQDLLQKGDYLVIVDDDNPGEAADVVAIRAEQRTISVEFHHCKFAVDGKVSGEVKNLYEVCGQAQKSVRWMSKSAELFKHLIKRERDKMKKHSVSRLEKGNQQDLLRLAEMSRTLPVRLTIYIVQPGLSQSKATDSQLELLSVTENYLKETYEIPLTVVGSG